MAQGVPNTAAGKAASARNSLRHGLLSDTPLVTRHETQEDWDAHRQAVLADLQPQDHLQTCLAERVALLHWRLRRAAVAELEVMEGEALMMDQFKNPYPHARTDGWPLVCGLNSLERVARYEAHLSRELTRTMKALHDLQSRPVPQAETTAKTENCETNSPPPTSTERGVTSTPPASPPEPRIIPPAAATVRALPVQPLLAPVPLASAGPAAPSIHLARLGRNGWATRTGGMQTC